MAGGGDRVLLLAHRAGNDLVRLRSAEAAGADVVEADVHLFHGRLEVRHQKTVGPLPLYWDRWELGRPFAPRLTLDELLAAVAPGTELMLDLKGLDPRLPRLVQEALDRRPASQPVTVCSRTWAHVDRLAPQAGLRRVYSAGSRVQLAALRRRLRTRSVDGVSVHARLLEGALVSGLRDCVATVMSWPVNSRDHARRLAGLGVNGLISDELDLLAELAGARSG